MLSNFFPFAEKKSNPCQIFQEKGKNNPLLLSSFNSASKQVTIIRERK